jgi:aminopeptidase N
MNFSKINLSICFFLISFGLLASGPGNNYAIFNINHNQRSDTVDVLHYHVNLNITSVTSSPIGGYTDVRFTPKINGVSHLSLDLLKMNIDSVNRGASVLSYSYNDTLLVVNLGNQFNLGDTLTIRVAYHGIPQIDPSGFGGFSFSSGYAYNLGVGFSADPHVYGRVWHPCFDNFVERATYSFAITTSNAHKAVCNGAFTGQINNPNNTVTWNWFLQQDIPSYLACIAVANYATVNQTFSGVNGNVPVELVAVPSDTTNMKNAFVNLEAGFDAFEERFGPYLWSKVGYVLVPFNGGAMEHATNIAYPRVAVTSGSTAYEAELMSHELSHHWFGDLVTCETAEDMWLNEGWASFSAFIFTESLYGWEAYKNAVRSNQAKILQHAHIKEGGYRAVSGVPHEYTYGDHVYLKGAAIAHTIRAYMGDSLFFNAVKYYLNNNAFGNADSDKMRQDFEASSGLDLSHCFNNWVFNAGYAHFSIDSMQITPSGSSSQVQVFVKQKLTGAPNLFTNVPLEITFMNNSFQSYTSSVIMSGTSASFSINVPFLPTLAAVDMEGRLSLAVVTQYKTIKTTGVNNFPDLKINFNISSVSDSALLMVQHHFTAPDPVEPWSGYIISPNRYHKIDGIFPAGFKGTATMIYDGRSATASGNQFLDNLLFTSPYNEDSLVLLYRSSPAESWSKYPYYTKLMSNTTDKYGTIRIDSIQKGEYALAMKTAVTAVKEKPVNKLVKITPNPAKETVTLDLADFLGSTNIIECNIFSAEGRWVGNYKIPANTNSYQINLHNLNPGLYHFTFNDGISYDTAKVLLSR